MSQLSLDFAEYKRDALVTFRCPGDLKDELTAMARWKGMDVSAMVQEYVLAGLCADVEFKCDLLDRVSSQRAAISLSH